jgi:hypothetical protein
MFSIRRFEENPLTNLCIKWLSSEVMLVVHQLRDLILGLFAHFVSLCLGHLGILAWFGLSFIRFLCQSH